MKEENKTASPKKNKRLGFLMVGGFLVPFIVLVIAVLGYGGWQLTYNPKTCNLCHNIQPYVESYYQSENLDNVHADANVGCKECHKASVFSVVDEGWKYITGNYNSPMREIEYSKDQCLDCHRSYESLKDQTKDLQPNPHDSPHSANAECSTCHKSHRESTILCSQCHQVEYDIEYFQINQ